MSKSETMVNMHVLNNASQLMDLLLKHEDYQDSLASAFLKDDFESPAFEEGYTIVLRRDIGLYLIDPEGENCGNFASADEAWEKACEIAELEPYMDEVMEYWIVSDMLAYQLLKRGEMVEEVLGMNIWGRCATGSAIYMDDVMVTIAKETSI